MGWDGMGLSLNLLLGFLFLGFENEIFAGYAFIDVKHIVASGFKMGGGIIRGGDEDLVLGAIFDRLKRIHNTHKLLSNGTKEIEGWLEFLEGLISFHGGRYNGDVLPLGYYVVGEGNAPNVDIRAALDLLLRDDNLT